MGINPDEFSLITLLCILGAAAAVLICWAISHQFYGSDQEIPGIGSEQAVYMRQVRLMNLEKIGVLMGKGGVVYSADIDDSLVEHGRQ